MSNVRLHAASWNRFITRGFGIKYELLGASHEFHFQGCQISIQLPKHAAFLSQHDDEARASVFKWREENDEKIPLEAGVSSVDVTVQMIEEVVIPGEVLQVYPNAYELLVEDQQNQLNTLASKYGTIAGSAFDWWIRILRWKANSSIIGRPNIQGSASGWGTYLFEPESQKRFWSGERILTLPRVATFDKSAWDEAQQTLQSGAKPPVFIELMFDAIEHMEIGDLQRAVLDMAVACEIYMRRLVMQQLPDSLTARLRKYIDDANIRQVIDHFLKEILDDKEQKTLRGIRSDLHKLFDLRNAILHSGGGDDLTLDECNKYLEVTRRLIAIRLLT